MENFIFCAAYHLHSFREQMLKLGYILPVPDATNSNFFNKNLNFSLTFYGFNHRCI